MTGSFLMQYGGASGRAVYRNQWRIQGGGGGGGGGYELSELQMVNY